MVRQRLNLGSGPSNRRHAVVATTACILATSARRPPKLPVIQQLTRISICSRMLNMLPSRLRLRCLRSPRPRPRQRSSTRGGRRLDSRLSAVWTIIPSCCLLGSDDVVARLDADGTAGQPGACLLAPSIHVSSYSRVVFAYVWCVAYSRQEQKHTGARTVETRTPRVPALHLIEPRSAVAF